MRTGRRRGRRRFCCDAAGRRRVHALSGGPAMTTVVVVFAVRGADSSENPLSRCIRGGSLSATTAEAAVRLSGRRGGRRILQLDAINDEHTEFGG
jgi:hypothetical protein